MSIVQKRIFTKTVDVSYAMETTFLKKWPLQFFGQLYKSFFRFRTSNTCIYSAYETVKFYKNALMYNVYQGCLL